MKSEPATTPDAEPEPAPPPRRLDWRALVWAIAALGVEYLGFLLGALFLGPAYLPQLAIRCGLAGIALAVPAFVYAFFASRRGQWGPVLLVAWILAVTAVACRPQPFVYFE